MEYSLCEKCGKKIHRQGMGKPDDWFDEQGDLCLIPNHPPAGSSFWRSNHKPQEENMTSYTEKEICEAGKRLPYTTDTIIGNLKKAKDTHVHDFTDTDTVTVKEIREAFRRLLPSGNQLGFFTEKGNSCDEVFLRDISEHREPEYPCGSVWKDPSGRIWLRTSDGMWARFGKTGTWDHGTLQLPLRRMDVVKE